MPKNPKRPCRYPGCPNLCESGTYCPEHSAESPDRLRGNATERGYDAKWRRTRRQFLQKHPLCANCLSKGVLTPAQSSAASSRIVATNGFSGMNKTGSRCAKACHDRKTGSGL